MQQTMTLPYLRTSPVQLPRRDLVLSTADSLLLSVIVVESDTPAAEVLIRSTDINGPSMQLAIWADTAWQHCGWDYGRPPMSAGTVLQSITGIPGDASGSFDFHIPTGTFSGFPLRCGWAVLLLWENGARSSVLAQGIAHFRQPFFKGVPITEIPPIGPPVIIPPLQPSLVGLTTDDLHPIITSDTTGANAARQLETS
jgi:hypothetical protein